MFLNRIEAGRELAEDLQGYKAGEPIILALPRGGVPIGYEVAQALKAPLYVFVVRKVGTPWNPELGIGAVASGVQILDYESLEILGIDPTELEEIIEREQQEVKRRQKLYGQDEDFPDIREKTVILVDDGIATGITTRGAIQAIRHLKPSKLVLAVPVGPLETVNSLRELVDDLICLESPADFYAVSAFYRSFPQVSDEEVINLLKKAKKERKIDTSRS
jgi:putative phosphoribosyl transferase